MNPSAILALLLMIALLGGVVFYGMNPGQPTTQTSQPTKTVQPIKTAQPTQDLNVAEFEERLRNVQSEQEIIEIVKEVAYNPEVLKECAKLAKEFETARINVDMNNERSKQKVLDIYMDMNDLFCLATIDEWK